MPSLPNQATRRIIESFQQRNILAPSTSTGKKPDIAGLPAGPAGPTDQDIRDFEAKINAPDYPKELREAYYVSKSKNDYTYFNDMVQKYNETQAAKQAAQEKARRENIAKIEADVSKPDYPEELKKAFYEAKEKDDFTGFNAAVERYNARVRTEYEAERQRQAAFAVAAQQQVASQREKAIKDIAQSYDIDEAEITKLVKTLETNPKDPILTNNEVVINAVRDIISKVPDIPSGAAQQYYDRIYETVGTDLAKPQYILKSDFEAFKEANKDAPGLIETLKKKGVEAANAAMTAHYERKSAELADWEREVLPNMPAEYQAAYRAKDYDKLAKLEEEFKASHTQLPDGLWIAKSDLKKIDPYMKDIMLNQGYAAYEKAMAKREADLAGISQRQQIKFIQSTGELEKYLNSPEAPRELKSAYYGALKAGGIEAAIEAYNSALVKYNATSDKYMAQLKEGGYLNEDGTIKVMEYLQDAGDFERGLAANIAVRRLQERLAAEKKALGLEEYNRLLEDEIKKVQQEYQGVSIEDRVKILEHLGVDAEAIKEAEYNAKLTGPQRTWQATTPWSEYKGEKANIKGVTQMAADNLLPGFYVARAWKDLSNAERALYIVGDALMVLFPAAGVLKAGATAARAVGYSSRAARLGAALKAGGKVAMHEALGPLNIVIHPIASARVTKKWLRDTAELFTDPRRVTEAVVTNSSGQIMLRASEMRTAEDAARAVDELMAKVKRGERLFVEVGDARVELHPGALSRGVGGYSHATTDLTQFEQGLTVQLKEGMPVDEQGLFIASEPVTQYTTMSASGKGAIPLPTQAGGAAEKVWYYKPEDIARMDADPIRELTFRHAKNMPAELADDIEAIVKKYKGRIGGSLNTYLKVPGAARPDDIDVVFSTPEIARKAQSEIIEAAKRKGFDVQPGTIKRDVSIKKGGKYVSIIDCDAVEHHDAMIPKEYIQEPRDINGFQVETLGEQYIRQSYGAVAGSKQAKRTTAVNKMARVLAEKLKADGAIVRRPGIIIYNGPKTMAKAVSTGKLFYAQNPVELGWVKEAESKFAVGTVTPNGVKSLWFRTGPNDLKMEVILEKPLTRRQLLKFKMLSLSGIEELKAPFKPAITVKRTATVPVSEKEARTIVRMLRREGNITAQQGSNILSAVRVANAVGATSADVKNIQFINRPETVTTTTTTRTQSVTAAPRTPARPARIKGRDMISPVKFEERPEHEERKEERKRDKDRFDHFRVPEVQELRGLHGAARAKQGERLPPRTAEARGKAETGRTIPGRALAATTTRGRAGAARAGTGTPARRTTPRPPRVPAAPPSRVPTPRTPPPGGTPPPRVPPPPPPPRIRQGGDGFKLGVGASDKEKRQAIKAGVVSVAYRMGELKGRDVWHTFVYTGDKGGWQRIIVMGKRPEGVTKVAKGRESAFKTIQSLSRTKKLPGMTLTEDVGIVRAHISLGKGKPGIEFKPDRESATPKAPPITPRTPAITPRVRLPGSNNIRITPPTPRISPRWRRLS